MGKRGARTVTLEDDDEGTESLFVEIPKSLAAYVKSRMKTQGKTKKEVVIFALELNRDLDDKLKPESAKIRAYAEKHRMRMGKETAEVLARLVRNGLLTVDPDE